MAEQPERQQVVADVIADVHPAAEGCVYGVYIVYTARPRCSDVCYSQYTVCVQQVSALTAAAHVYTLYALYPYTMYSDHACNMYTFYTAKIQHL